MSTRMSAGRVRRTYECIKTHRVTYSVQAWCRVLDGAPGGYYARLKPPLSKRAQEDARLPRLIRTTPEQAGQVFARVKPRLAVHSHAPATPSVIEQTRKTCSGPLEGAEDLLTVELGEQIAVRHVGRK